MQTNEFINLVSTECLEPILHEYNISRDDLEVIQVWYCKTIQNHKGLFIVKNNKTQSIYKYFIEATYNGVENELYLDFYTKSLKQIVKC